MNKNDKAILKKFENEREEQVERPDLKAGRADQSTYIHKIERPKFTDRGEQAVAMYENGMPLKQILKASGFSVAGLYSVLGLKPEDDIKQFNDLKAYKEQIIMGKEI